MKQLQCMLLSMVVLLVFTACSSDDDAQSPEAPLTFETLTMADIAALEEDMGVFSQNGTNDGGILWESGKVLLYKTSDDRFGKLKVLNISSFGGFTLTITAITYNEDGSIYNSDDFLQISGNSMCDLDDMNPPIISSPFDFRWHRVTESTTRIESQNEALFVEWDN